LIVLRRARRRAPNLTLSDRLLFGFGSLFLGPGRIRKLAIALRPSTLLAFHQALVHRKDRRLFSSTPCPKKPGPKGPDEALIHAIVELKSRHPRFGCPRMARIISQTFGVDIRQERRVPRTRQTLSPSLGGNRPLVVVVYWTQHRQPVARGPRSLRVHRATDLLGARGHGPVHASPHRHRRARRSGHGCRRVPHVQRRHPWSRRTATSQHRS